MKVLVIAAAVLTLLSQTTTSARTEAPGLRGNDSPHRNLRREFVWDCPDACHWTWIGDGYCDDICNHPGCRWDDGDCGYGQGYSSSTFELTIKTCDKMFAGSSMNPKFTVYRKADVWSGPSRWTFSLGDSVGSDEDLPRRNKSKTYQFTNMPTGMDIDMNLMRMVATSNSGYCLESLTIKYGREIKTMRARTSRQSEGLWLASDWRTSSEGDESNKWYLRPNRYATKNYD